MRFRLGKCSPEKQKRLSFWHNWFAWHPVRLVNGEWCWLERVARRGWYHPNFRNTIVWEYLGLTLK